MKEFDVVIIKECHATVRARSEKEARDIAYDLLGEENYNGSEIKKVYLQGEVDREDYDDEDDFIYDDPYYDLGLEVFNEDDFYDEDDSYKFDGGL